MSNTLAARSFFCSTEGGRELITSSRNQIPARFVNCPSFICFRDSPCTLLVWARRALCKRAREHRLFCKNKFWYYNFLSQNRSQEEAGGSTLMGAERWGLTSAWKKNQKTCVSEFARATLAEEKSIGADGFTQKSQGSKGRKHSRISREMHSGSSITNSSGCSRI